MNSMKGIEFYIFISIIIGYILDLFIKDPNFKLHPIRIIGKLIETLENILLKNEYKNKKKYILGIVLVFLVIIITLLAVFLIDMLIKFIDEFLGIKYILFTFVTAFLIYFSMATASLYYETNKVYKCLKNKDIKKAREQIKYLVSRDTDNLNEAEITKALIETVSENLVDGIISPLIYISFFGIYGAYFYKAVNTMDSMVGYKNEKYLYFGRFAAKFDDVLNYVPARITPIYMIIAGIFTKSYIKNAVNVLKRDRYNHDSPNSGMTEATMAGLLGIKISGKNYYFNKLVTRKDIGNKIKDITIDEYKKAIQIVYISTVIAMIISIIILYFRFLLLKNCF